MYISFYTHTLHCFRKIYKMYSGNSIHYTTNIKSLHESCSFQSQNSICHKTRQTIFLMEIWSCLIWCVRFGYIHRANKARLWRLRGSWYLGSCALEFKNIFLGFLVFAKLFFSSVSDILKKYNQRHQWKKKIVKLPHSNVPL